MAFLHCREIHWNGPDRLSHMRRLESLYPADWNIHFHHPSNNKGSPWDLHQITHYGTRIIDRNYNWLFTEDQWSDGLIAVGKFMREFDRQLHYPIIATAVHEHAGIDANGILRVLHQKLHDGVFKKDFSENDVDCAFFAMVRSAEFTDLNKFRVANNPRTWPLECMFRFAEIWVQRLAALVENPGPESLENLSLDAIEWDSMMQDVEHVLLINEVKLDWTEHWYESPRSILWGAVNQAAKWGILYDPVAERIMKSIPANRYLDNFCDIPEFRRTMLS